MLARRLVAAAAVALIALAPTPAVARVKKVDRAEYVTTYSGTYTYTQAAHSHIDDGRPSSDLTTDERESFFSVDHNTITIFRGGRFKNVHERSLTLSGHEHQDFIQGYGQPGGPFTTTRDCTASTLSDKPIRSEDGGVGALPVPISKNPMLSVGWEIPDYGTSPVAGVPPISITGMRCDGFGNRFLDCIPASCGTTHTPVPFRASIARAFSGAVNIRYSQLPWSASFDDLEADGHTETSGRLISNEDAKVVVNTAVEMVRWDSPSRPTEQVNKIGALLISEGFGSITGQGRPGRGPAGGSGEPETVVIPPVGQGTLHLNVSGTVVSPRVNAAASTTLAAGTVTFGRQPLPGRMTITPTAAGRKLLASPHPALKLRYVLTFTPRGSKKSISRAKLFDVPAFTPGPSNP